MADKKDARAADPKNLFGDKTAKAELGSIEPKAEVNEQRINADSSPAEGVKPNDAQEAQKVQPRDAGSAFNTRAGTQTRVIPPYKR